MLRPVIDVLWNLTFQLKAVERATVAGAVPRVASVPLKHMANPDVLGGACAELLNLAVNEENRHQIVRCGGTESLITAIMEHEAQEKVVEHACQALYLLACDTELGPSVVAASLACKSSCAGDQLRWSSKPSLRTSCKRCLHAGTALRLEYLWLIAQAPALRKCGTTVIMWTKCSSAQSRRCWSASCWSTCQPMVHTQHTSLCEVSRR